VFVVASARADFDPTKVLFESEGVRRDIAPSREARKEVTELAGTLTANGGGLNRPAGNGNELDFCVTSTRTFDFQSSGEYGTAQVAATLAARDYKSAKDLAVMPIAFPANLSGTQCASSENLSPSMGSKNPTAVTASMAVRRLTPVECERLQGFPDNYTNIPWRKATEAPDGPRYKALGNSWAVPVVRWIGERIQDQIK
jgi:DNA (cytosine-5)-methyltransferase 1